MVQCMSPAYTWINVSSLCYCISSHVSCINIKPFCHLSLGTNTEEQSLQQVGLYLYVAPILMPWLTFYCGGSPREGPTFSFTRPPGILLIITCSQERYPACCLQGLQNSHHRHRSLLGQNSKHVSVTDSWAAAVLLLTISFQLLTR